VSSHRVVFVSRHLLYAGGSPDSYLHPAEKTCILSVQKKSLDNAVVPGGTGCVGSGTNPLENICYVVLLIALDTDTEGKIMNALSRNLRLAKTLLIALIMSCALSAAAQATEVVRIGGAGAGLGVMKSLALAFEKSHPGTKVRVLPSLGSSGGIKALLHGALDVAISGRALRAEELKDGARAVECARTPFVFAVNKNINKADVTTRELEMIYKGELSKWSNGTRIRLVLRPAGDTDTMIVRNISKEMEQGVNASNARPEMIMAVTDQEATDAVAKIPGAIGGSTLAQIETENQPVNVLSFNGIKPTLDTIAKGSYPLVKPLYLVTVPTTSASALQFIQFARSAKGRAILAKSGALPTGGDMRTK
jgi:phosphate transport system substrate-binding protein